MSKEVAKCPRCKNDPIKIQFTAGGWGYRCCGHESACLYYWNRYATAMELAQAKAWLKEVQVLNRKTQVEFATMYEAKEGVRKAEKHVIDTFK